MSGRGSLRVNGAAVDVAVDDDGLAPLSSALHDGLGLRSVREACGVGACGACSVLVDGRPVKACLQAVGLVGDAEVTTVEGLPPDDPVVAAFAARNAFQCGYCIPGFVIAVHGLLAAQPAPSEAEVRRALAGNLCRCGSYTLILEAVADVIAGLPPAAPATPPAEPAEAPSGPAS